MSAIPRTAAFPPPPAPLPHRASPDAAAAHARQQLGVLSRALDAHAAATAAGRSAPAAIADARSAVHQVTADIETVASRRFPDGWSERRAVARELAGALGSTVARTGGIWSVPAESMKPLANVQRAATALQAAARAPETDFSLTSRGGGTLALLDNAFSRLRVDGAAAGPGYRAAGLARATDDSLLRIGDGIAATASGRPFRAAKQAEAAMHQLELVARDAGSALAGDQRAAVQTAAERTRSALGDPAAARTGTPQVRAALESLRAAAAPLARQLGDAAAAAVGPAPPADRARLAAWREPAQGARNRQYYDADISGD